MTFGLGFGFFPRHFQAGIPGQDLYCLGKIHTIEFLNEADGIATGTTAKTVIELLLGLNTERRSLFVMEGAAGGVVLAGLFQAHPFVDYLDNIDPMQQVVDKTLRDESGHQSFLSGTGEIQ
jgi:hypothetical protein